MLLLKCDRTPIGWFQMKMDQQCYYENKTGLIINNLIQCKKPWAMHYVWGFSAIGNSALWMKYLCYYLAWSNVLSDVFLVEYGKQVWPKRSWCGFSMATAEQGVCDKPCVQIRKFCRWRKVDRCVQDRGNWGSWENCKNGDSTVFVQ